MTTFRDDQSPELCIKLQMQNGDILAVYRIKNDDRDESNPCLKDHSYGLPYPVGEDEEMAPRSDGSAVEASTLCKVEPADAFEDHEDDGLGDFVSEVKTNSIIEEHSYSNARFLCADGDIWKVAGSPGNDDDDDGGNGAVLVEDFFEFVGGSRFSDSSVIVDLVSPPVSDDDFVVVDFDEDSTLQSIFENEAINVGESSIDFNSILEVLEGNSRSISASSANEREEEEDLLPQRRNGDLSLVVHSCKICDRVFEARADLLKHYSSHARDKNSPHCCNCGVSFQSTVDLLIHRKRHNECGNSGGGGGAAAAAKVVRRRRSSSSNSLSEDAIPPEMHRAKNTVYRCLHCSKPFFIFTQLVAHQENHSADKDQFYKCPICSGSFTSLDRLILHGNDHEDDHHEAKLRSNHHHVGGNEQTDGCQPVDKTSSSRQSKKSMSCVYCGESFRDPKLMSDHLRTHAKGKKKLACSFCPEFFEDPKELSHHRLAHLKDRNLFVFGQRDTHDDNDVADDEETETTDPCEPVQADKGRDVGESSFRCVKVEESLGETEIGAAPSDQSLIKFEAPDYSYPGVPGHSWLPPQPRADGGAPVAPKPKDFICPDCEVGFATLNKLAAHVRRCHPFVCRDCQRTFKWLDDLNVHRQVYFMKPCYRWSRCPKLAFSHQKRD